MDWSALYPAYAMSNNENHTTGASPDQQPHDEGKISNIKSISKDVEIADIGCGFGGLLFALAPQFPDSLILGMCYLITISTYD